MFHLPNKVRKVLSAIQDEQITQLASNIKRIKAMDNTLPSYIADAGWEYYSGMLQGHYHTIEAFLSVYNLYKGYQDHADGYRVYVF